MWSETSTLILDFFFQTNKQTKISGWSYWFAVVVVVFYTLGLLPNKKLFSLFNLNFYEMGPVFNDFKGSQTGHSVKVSLWYASLTLDFAFFILE